MKKYNEFINESIRDLLVGKSEVDILIELDKLSNNEKIKSIIHNKLNYNLLPRNKKGECVFEGNLYLNAKDITHLPDNLTVIGNLNVSYNELTELPKGLKIFGTIYCHHNKVKLEKPDDAYIKFNFFNK